MLTDSSSNDHYNVLLLQRQYNVVFTLCANWVILYFVHEERSEKLKRFNFPRFSASNIERRRYLQNMIRKKEQGTQVLQSIQCLNTFMMVA